MVLGHSDRRLPGSGIVFLLLWNSLPWGCQSHTSNSEGCSRAGMALGVDALCVVFSFILLFALLHFFAVLLLVFNLTFHPIPSAQLCL